MLQAAGIGVAVENATAEAKAAADHITVSNENHALARIIADLEEEQRCARLRRNQEVFHPGKTSHGKSFHMPFHMALMHSFFSTAVQGVLWRQSFRGH